MQIIIYLTFSAKLNTASIYILSEFHVIRKLNKGQSFYWDEREDKQLIHHRNLKMLVHTPHNTLVIMLGRDKNFQVLMMYELQNRENQITLC